MTTARTTLSSAPSWTTTATRASIEAGRVNDTARLAVPQLTNQHTVKENNS
ncbi:hypothetical protein HLY00_429 [Mycolicibacterium hippocampi]|uniref:Uncharacterized protein n=1 Tax=Mycolicibacterium hippocampi TaxID=659824 RepID=A0A850PLY4_9MYCO|nr:hypothetical protein [Mycolicibacterium hippocampi]